MNIKPHTHDVEVKRDNYGIWNNWSVIYGDQTVAVGRTLTKKKLDKAVARAIAQHEAGTGVAKDEESLKDYARSLRPELTLEEVAEKETRQTSMLRTSWSVPTTNGMIVLDGDGARL